MSKVTYKESIYSAYSSRGLESMAIMLGTWQQAGRHDAEAVSESIHFGPWERTRANGEWCGLLKPQTQ